MDAFDVTVHRSLTRPMLMMGGERELVLMLAMVCGIFIVSLFQLWAAITGVALWAAGVFALQRAGEKDPQLSKTFIRSLRFGKLLRAQSTPFAAPSVGKGD